MSKSEWFWVARYLIIISISFLTGYFIRSKMENDRTVKMIVTQPDDCKQFGLKPIGWEFQALYKGGINQGGASSFITYECK